MAEVFSPEVNAAVDAYFAGAGRQQGPAPAGNPLADAFTGSVNQAVDSYMGNLNRVVPTGPTPPILTTPPAPIATSPTLQVIGGGPRNALADVYPSPLDELGPGVASTAAGAARAAGRAMGRGGKLLEAAAGDIASIPSSIAGYTKPLENITAFSKEPWGTQQETLLPIEQRANEAGTVGRFVMKAGLMPFRMEPQLAASFGLGALGAPSAIAAAAPMFVSEQGEFDPVGAAIAAGLPGVNRFGEKAVAAGLAKIPISKIVIQALASDPEKLRGKVIQELGGVEISSDVFRRFLETGGGFVAANAYLLAARAPQLLGMKPEDRNQAILDTVAQNIAPSLMGFLRPGLSHTLERIGPEILRQMPEGFMQGKAPGPEAPPPEPAPQVLSTAPLVTPVTPPETPVTPAPQAPITPTAGEPNAPITPVVKGSLPPEPPGAAPVGQTPAGPSPGNIVPSPAGGGAGGIVPNVSAPPPVPQVQAPAVVPPQPPVAPTTPTSLALQAQREAGWDPKWPFVPADFGNKSFRDAIESDPTLTPAQKNQMFGAAEKLLGGKIERAVVPPQPPVTPPVAPTPPTTPPPPVALPSKPVPAPTLDSVLAMPPGDFFDQAQQWANAESSGKDLGPQRQAEAAARLLPDLAKWQAAYQQAAAEAARIKAEIAQDPKSLEARQKEVMGIAQKAQFFSEGIKEIQKTAAPAKLPIGTPVSISATPPAGTQPAPQLNLMGVDVVPTDTKEIEGVRYELFGAANPQDPRAVVRVTDTDSGKVVTLKAYPDHDTAAVDYAKAIQAANAPKPKQPTNMPEGWTSADVQELLDKVKAGQNIVLTINPIGMPSFDEIPNAEHKGFGMFKASSPAYEVTFDGGGAMNHTQASGHSFTNVGVNRGEFPYPREAIIANLEGILAGKPPVQIDLFPKPPETKPEVPNVEQQPKSPVGGGRPGGEQPPTPGAPGPKRRTGASIKRPTRQPQPPVGGGIKGPAVPAPDVGGLPAGGEANANANRVPGEQGPAPAQPEAAAPSGEVPAKLPGQPTEADPAPEPEIDAPADKPKNIHLTENPAPTGAVSRIRANIAAIRLLKDLEQANRFPTDEERMTLAAWSGWGSFKEIFNEGKAEKRDWDPGWTERYGKFFDQLKSLMTDEEFLSGAISSINAHYTSREAVLFQWDLARRLGFTGGRALDPSAGIGAYQGYMPEDLAKKTHWTAAEMDLLTGRLFAYLYPEVDIRIQPFETTKIPNGFYDLTTSNVPFAKEGPGMEYPTLNLHNYFIARMLDKLKPGGLLVAITSNSTMDNNPEQREILAGKADLVGAVRLPNNAFKESAATEVVTDILVLRKRDGKPFQGQEWSLTRPVSTPQGPTAVNEYYANHPEMVLGQHSLTGTMYREDSYTVVGSGNLAAKLAAVLEQFPKDIVSRVPVPEALEPTATALEDYSLVLEKGRVLESRNFMLQVPINWDPASVLLNTRAKLFVQVKDALLKQYALERDAKSNDQQIEANRKALQKAYASLKGNVGNVLNESSRKLDFLERDPHYMSVMGLERLVTIPDPNKPGEQTQAYVPSDVLTQRVIQPDAPPEKVDNVPDALAVCLSYKGELDVDYIRQLTGMTQEAIESELVATGAAFKDPDSGKVELASRYLSGEVREKLAKAIFAANESPIFKPNVEALRAAIPETIPFGKIKLAISARWVPVEVMNKFAEDVIGLPDNPVSFVPTIEEWAVTGYNRGLTGVAKAKWSTKDLNAFELLAHAMNFKRARIMKALENEKGNTIYREDTVASTINNQVIDAMIDEFEKWIRTTKSEVPYRYFDSDKGAYVAPNIRVWDALEREFNKRTNSFVAPERKGDYLKLPGLSLAVRREAHLLAGVARVVTDRAMVAAHATGSGKTFLAIIACHELQRLGMANKMVIVIKKSTVAQYRRSIDTAYPGSKVLIPNKSDFEPANRRALAARMTSGKWDFIVITHENFKAIRASEASVKRFFDDQIAQLRAVLKALGHADAEKEKSTRGMDPAVKSVVQRIKMLQKKLNDILGAADARIQKLRDELKHLGHENAERETVVGMPTNIRKLVDQIKAIQRKQADPGMVWEDIGIDGLWIDESHNFKNLPIPTQMENIKGVPTSFSNRAIDMLIKARDVQRRTGGRNIFFASGTPIANTLAEVWVMLHATNPKLLKQFGIETFDSFASAFADVKENFELGWDQKFHNVTRMNRFKNPQGLAMLTQIGVDVRIGNKKLGLDVPNIEGGKPTVIAVKSHAGFERWVKLLLDVAAKWAASKPKERYENSWVPVTTMRAGVAAALDPRCVFPDAPDHPDSKVNTAVRTIYEQWLEGKDRRTTMMVFADMYRTLNTDKLMAWLGRAPVATSTPTEISDEPDPAASVEEGAPSIDEEFAAHAVGGFNVYNDIRAKLVKLGIPADEIGIITEHDTDTKREKLFDRVRSGSCRILIGGTEKIGEGVDVPQRMSAQVHLDPPMAMTSAKFEQRLGRIIRQGNLHSPKNWNIPVRIFMFAQEKSMDAPIYQMLEAKAIMVLQFLEGRMLGDEFEDPASDLTVAMAVMKAAATGDKRILQLAELEKLVRDLSLKEGAYYRRLSELQREIDMADSSARSSAADAINYRAIAKVAQEVMADKKTLVMTHGDTRIVGAEEIQKSLDATAERVADMLVKEKEVDKTFNVILGGKLYAKIEIQNRPKWSSPSVNATFHLGDPTYGNARWVSELSAGGNVKTLLQAAAGFPHHAEIRAQVEDTNLAARTKDSKDFTDQLNSMSFPEAAALKENKAKLDALKAELEAEARAPQVATENAFSKLDELGQSVSPPLAVRLQGEIQQLTPEWQTAQDAADRAGGDSNLSVKIASLKGEIDTARSNKAEIDPQRRLLLKKWLKLQKAADELSARLDDLYRRLGVVQKAQITAGTTANPQIPYSRTPTHRPGVAYSIEASVGDPVEEQIVTGLQEIARLFNDPRSGLSADTRRVALDLLNTPVMQQLDWSNLRLALLSRMQGASGTANVVDNLIQMVSGSGPKVFPHEIAHFLKELLDPAALAILRNARMDEITRRLQSFSSNFPPEAVSVFAKLVTNGMTSAEFWDLLQTAKADDPDFAEWLVSMYPLINDSEFLAWGFSERFSGESFKGRNDGWFKRFFKKVKAWFQAIIDSIRRLVGIKPDLDQIIRDLAAGKYRNTPEGGAESEQTRYSIDPATQKAQTAQAAAEQEKQYEGITGVKTQVFGVEDFVRGREQLTPQGTADAVAYAKSIFDQAKIPVTQTGVGIWQITPTGFTMDIEGRKLVELLKREISTKNQPGKPGDLLASLLNSIVYNFKAGALADFPEPVRNDLYDVAQSDRSQRGLALGALSMHTPDMQFVAANVDVVLHRIYADAFGGDSLRAVADRIMEAFRAYFTEEEIRAAFKDKPNLETMLAKFQALDAREAGGKVYRAVQRMLKPKGLAKLSFLESNARIQEAIDQIIENAKALGVEPVKSPNKPLSPIERLQLMTAPETADKIDKAIATAVAQAERNAGIKATLLHAQNEAEVRDLQERFAAGENPEPEMVDEGLQLPEFAHWGILRDDLLGYSPTTLKLVQDLIRSGFKGAKFGEPEAKPPDLRINLTELAKQSEAEVQRVMDAYMAGIEANLDIVHAEPQTRLRVKGMIERELVAQLELARARVREVMFEAAKTPAAKPTPEQMLAKQINAKLFADPRLDIPELIARVANKGRIQALMPKVGELVKRILATPVYRQAEIGERFTAELVQRLGLPQDQADAATAVFMEAFQAPMAKARESALKQVVQSLTPKEDTDLRPEKRSGGWQKLEKAVNAGLFDSGSVLAALAAARGWQVPTEQMKAHMRATAEKEQRLRLLTPAEAAAAGTPAAQAAAQCIKEAATREKRVPYLRQMSVMWARFTRPISWMHPIETRKNIAAAANEYEVADLLFKLGFPIRLTTHITTQLLAYLPTRAIADAWGRISASRSAKRPTEAWREVGLAFGDTLKATLAAIKPALSAFRESVAGRAEAKNVDRLMSGIQALDRMAALADEHKAKGDYVRWGLINLLGCIRLSLRITQAIDNLQGEPVEFQSLMAQIEDGMREQGRSPAEIQAAKDQVFGDMKAQFVIAMAHARRVFDATGQPWTEKEVRRAAWPIIHAMMYNAVEALGLSADDFEAENRILRATQAWQVQTTKGVGGVIANTMRRTSEVAAEGGIPLSFARFGNAVGTGVNYLLMFTPFFKFANAGGPGESTWFRTAKDRQQRIAMATLGTMFGSAIILLIGAGLLKVQRSWRNKSKAERDLLEAQGHRQGTVEIPISDTEFIPFSMLVGPFSNFSPYLYAGSAIADLLESRSKAQAKLDEEALRTGLPAGKLRPISAMDMLGVAGAAAEGALTGQRTAAGLSASVTEYGLPNTRKSVAAFVSPLVPGLPALQELSRMAGVSMDSKIASVWDYLVPMPTSAARAVNLLGDPVGTPDDVQRVIQTITSGTFPGAVSGKAQNLETAYATLFNSGYRPPAIEAGKGYAINGQFRPLDNEELAKYTVARGANLKQELSAIGPDATIQEAQTAYQAANARALETIGVDLATTKLAAKNPQSAQTAIGGHPASGAPGAPILPTMAALGAAGGAAGMGSRGGMSRSMRSLGRGGSYRSASIRRPAQSGIRHIGASYRKGPRASVGRSIGGIARGRGATRRPSIRR